MNTQRLKTRDSNIELVRFLAIIGVCVLHFNFYSWNYVADIFLNKAVLKVLQQIFICAVNLFMMISGYFMIEKRSVSLRKPIELIVQVVIVNYVLHAISL